MSTKTSRFLAVAATSLALSLGIAHAAQPDAPMGGPGGAGGWHGHFMKELSQLHSQLNLNADQEKQWQSALDTMKQTHEAERANHEQMKQQFKAMQQQPILDLNALHAAHQKVEQQDAQLREQSANAWLAFYNGLNDQQKTTVSTALKQRFAMMEQRHEKMRERWEQHRGAAPGGASTLKP
ncbi:periplasmic heavy metal sensor [Paraburkholderia sp. BL10I2N1]|uniref:periplasmic heavy metal sensor n=1 Tax=Paraburkholderia sp. BL10I2N1 TaxID=1938796 RepID=UPI00105E2CAD|nr:periplasmic heavy metal sensor [Paraburkholderia sp. BL10I2N1]TDN66927.1 heavy-metal resistance protein [Paraburkholderia sp. BL10I2N1]